MRLGTDAAWYDVHYIPRLPAALVRHLVRELALDGRGTLLDLECGTGDLALRMADWFESVIAVDPQWEKLAEARRLAEEQQTRTIRWVGSFDDLDQRPGSFRLVIARTECRRVDEQVITRAARLIEPEGAVALVGSRQVESPSLAALRRVVAAYGGSLDPGHLPDRRAQDALEASGLTNTGGMELGAEQRASAEGVIGLIYASSDLDPAHLGGQQEAFEDAVAQVVESEAAPGRFLIEQIVELRLFRSQAV
jgi:SAM-dependent methyltransferase